MRDSGSSRTHRAVLHLAVAGMLAIATSACGATVRDPEPVAGRSEGGGSAPAQHDREPVASLAPLSATVPLPERVEIGVGSGRDGLETIEIDGDGVAVIHRAAFGTPDWQRGTLVLSAEQRVAIAERIDHDQIYAMDGNYSAGVMDGTQLVLRILQDGDETVIYCDNECPPEVNAFSEAVHQLVEEADPAAIEWTFVSGSSHDDALWEAVTRLGPPRGVR